MALSETARLLAQLDYKDNLSAGVPRTLASVGRLESGLGRVGKGGAQIAAGLGRVALAGAAAAVGLGAAATKIGIDFQDAFAGVRKSVEGTPQELDGLYQSLQKLSTRIPVSFTDLAGIAQEAGALGVRTKDIDAFTEAVARTSAAAVGLPIEAASEAFGKLGTIFQLHGKDFDALGSTLVELGRKGASSEADIIEISKRFAAAGSVAGLSAAEVLGFSSAIASLGPEAESAGSSLSRIFNNINKFIGTGSDKVKAYAQVTGLSVKQFEKLYREDAAGAVELFLQKLGKLDRFQQASLLKKGGIVNVRDITAIQLLSGHTELLTSQVVASTKAWKDHTALLEVSEKRFDTLKSHLLELKGSVFVAAAGFSEGLTPAIDRLAKKAQTFVLGHLDDFKAFGREVGDAIDKIDWAKVESGAKTFISLLKTMLEVISRIPPEVDAAVVGFLGLNKLSGGLIGRGLENILGGLAGGLARGLAAKVPGVGSLVATPVYVVNFPVGLGGGAGAAGGLGGLISGGLKFVLPIAAGVLIANAIRELAGITPEESAARQSRGQFGPRSASNVPSGGVSSQIGGERAADARAREANAYYAAIERGITQGNRDLDKLDGTVAGVGHKVTSAAAAQKAALVRVLRDRDVAEAARGKQLRLAFSGALKEGSLEEARYLANRFDHSQAPFYRSMENARRELRILKAAQKEAIDRGATKTAHELGRDIRTMQRVIAGKAEATTRAARDTAAAVRRKKLSITTQNYITIPVSISVQRLANERRVYRRINSQSSSADPGQ